MSGRVWFITGASKGFGLELSKQVLARGWRLAATSRSVERLGSETDSFLPLSVDLESEDSVKTAIESTIEKFGRIDVIVNNAGYFQPGALEELSNSEIQESFNINLFGPINVIRQSLPYLRKQHSGLIINFSSIAGFCGNAFSSTYSMTKFALDGLSESLRLELKDFGIKVISVKPGQFRTDFLDSSSVMYQENCIHDYDEPRNAVLDLLMARNHQQTGDPVKLCKIIVDMSEVDDPPFHLFIGHDSVARCNNKLDEIGNTLEKYGNIFVSTNF